MLIGGFQKLSLIDFPNTPSSIVFTVGCMFRCKFCHNPELMSKLKAKRLYDENYILEQIKSRKKIIEGVVVSGGEPVFQNDLVEFIEKIRKLDLKVKLDTTGIKPNVLKFLITEKLIDYVAMDIKAPLNKYHEVVGVKFDTSRIKKSIELLLENNVDFEFRTTVHKHLTSFADILEITEEIKGAKTYILQKFSPINVFDQTLVNRLNYKDSEFTEMVSKIKDKFEVCYVR